MISSLRRCLTGLGNQILDPHDQTIDLIRRRPGTARRRPGARRPFSGLGGGLFTDTGSTSSLCRSSGSSISVTRRRVRRTRSSLCVTG